MNRVPFPVRLAVAATAAATVGAAITVAYVMAGISRAVRGIGMTATPDPLASPTLLGVISPPCDGGTLPFRLVPQED